MYSHQDGSGLRNAVKICGGRATVSDKNIPNRVTGHDVWEGSVRNRSRKAGRRFRTY